MYFGHFISLESQTHFSVCWIHIKTNNNKGQVSILSLAEGELS